MESPNLSFYLCNTGWEVYWRNIYRGNVRDLLLGITGEMLGIYWGNVRNLLGKC